MIKGLIKKSLHATVCVSYLTSIGYLLAVFPLTRFTMKELLKQPYFEVTLNEADAERMLSILLRATAASYTNTARILHEAIDNRSKRPVLFEEIMKAQNESTLAFIKEFEGLDNVA